MSDTLFQLLADYGIWLLAASCFLSCLLVPTPTSLLMLAAGAFVASGDLDAGNVLMAAWIGAILGDQTGFQIGRTGADHLERFARPNPKRATMLDKARGFFEKHGAIGVFFSTWLFSPLGPWVNMIAGAAKLGWLRFTIWDAAGEAIWVFGYIGLGYVFADQLSAVAEIAGNASGLLAAGALVIGLGLLLRARLRKIKAKQAMLSERANGVQ